MKAISDTLQVARSNLVDKAKRGGDRPRLQYRKAGEAELLARIRPLVDTRPSYGYRRITALLNRQAEAEGLARANHKRVYRVMKRAGLLPIPISCSWRSRTSSRRWHRARPRRRRATRRGKRRAGSTPCQSRGVAQAPTAGRGGDRA